MALIIMEERKGKGKGKRKDKKKRTVESACHLKSINNHASTCSLSAKSGESGRGDFIPLTKDAKREPRLRVSP